MNIVNSEKLTAIFGHWPSFHDATVKRVVIKDFPQRSVVARIHVFQMTQEVDAQGALALRNHTLATLAFSGVEDLVLENSASGMLLFGLRINEVGKHFTVDFEDAIGDGFALQFKCHIIEVLEVRACDFRGDLI